MDDLMDFWETVIGQRMVLLHLPAPIDPTADEEHAEFDAGAVLRKFTEGDRDGCLALGDSAWWTQNRFHRILQRFVEEISQLRVELCRVLPAPARAYLTTAADAHCAMLIAAAKLPVPKLTPSGGVLPGAGLAWNDWWRSDVILQADAAITALWSELEAGTSLPAEALGDLAHQSTVNARMIDLLQRRPESHAWSLRQWAKELGCGKSTVAEMPCWKTLQRAKADAKAALAEKSVRPWE